MSSPAPTTDFLASLGRLARGLSALFWGLPVSLAVCVLTARGERLYVLGILPPLAVMGLLLYGVSLLGRFQPQERVWMTAIERMRVLAIINVGLAPFAYWWTRAQGILPASIAAEQTIVDLSLQVSQIPRVMFFDIMAELLCLSWLSFLYLMNPLLRRLVAMVPDETLRQDARVFTRFNESLLTALIVLATAYFVLKPMQRLPRLVVDLLLAFEGGGVMVGLFILLIPVTLTMSLLWKTKEVILAGVFGGK